MRKVVSQHYTAQQQRLQTLQSFTKACPKARRPRRNPESRKKNTFSLVFFSGIRRRPPNDILAGLTFSAEKCRFSQQPNGVARKKGESLALAVINPAANLALPHRTIFSPRATASSSARPTARLRRLPPAARAGAIGSPRGDRP